MRFFSAFPAIAGAFGPRQRRIASVAARTVAAALLAYYASRAISLPEPSWASLSAVIATRGYAGAARHIGLGRVAGAFAGGAWAIAVIAADGGQLAGGALLAVVLVPPALLAAWKPLYRSSLVTALIILAAGGHAALGVACLRVAALGIGAAVAVAVSAWLWPQSAHDSAKALAAGISRTLQQALETPRQGTDAVGLEEKLRPRLESMNKLALVARREKTDRGRTEQLYTAAANAVCTVTVALRAAQNTPSEYAGTVSCNASWLRDLVRRDMLELERALKGARP